MSAARWSIGIDLGTTNSALAYAPLDAARASEMLAIAQVESAATLTEAPTLPSFLYLPEAAAARDAGAELDERWIVGRYARAKAADTPGRVVHSAKSWLAHHSADRRAPFLPWGSDDISRDDKLSPVDASALILRHLREAWDARFTDGGNGAPFAAQVVTITVPASFDAVAQQLTLDAARAAGYPADVRLLEEPQAALYRWLESHDFARDVWPHDAPCSARHVLVVDIGGGTSDFSLFAYHPRSAAGPARTERIAVSDHLLLGGDNMDLALAHRLEPQFSTDGEPLSGRRWEHLVARARDLKEAALAAAGAPDEVFSLSIPGRGSRLIAEATSAQIARGDVETLLLDGFFPHCAADEYPIRAKTALRELGLPYVRDPGVTRHLAEFLRDRPPVDAVLFNGGALHPQRLRARIVGEIGKWQSGAVPVVLENREPDLAVARGAAWFGKLVDARAARIEAGAAQAIFLQTERATADGDGGTLVCVLPHGAPTEETFAIERPAFALRVNRPVRFQAYASTRRERDDAGDIVRWNERDFAPLPPLETAIGADASAGETLPVRLTARLNELGRLELRCASVDPAIAAAWPLEFDLRASEGRGASSGRVPASAAADAGGPNAPPAALEAARARIAALFSHAPDPRDRLTANRLLKSLETILGVPRSAWNIALVRALWSALESHLADRERSVDHEEAWLIVAGFVLRPGFGAPLDDRRIDRLWTLHERGLEHDAASVRIQEYVLWRRVAGGLGQARQTALLDAHADALRSPKGPPPELVLLAGSLERIDVERKLELAARFTTAAAQREAERKHNAHYLTALGYLLNRAPLYAGPEFVVPSDAVQHAYDALGRFDWDGPQHLELQTAFLRAARVVDNRRLDVPRALRTRIADKLERAGVPPAKTAPLKDYVPMPRTERAGSFGESLPPGLVLRDPAAVA